MSVVFFEILFIFALVVVNGIFSMSEIAVLTSKKHALKSDMRRGSKRAKAVLDLAENPENFMSAVQVGITLIGIFTGVFSGATISELMTSRIAGLGVSVEFAQAIAMFVTVSAITYVTLIFGELLPKRIALASPNKSAKTIAPFIRFVQFVAHPVVVIISRNVVFLSRMLKIHENAGSVTEEDVRSVIEEAKAVGVIEHEEKNILHRVMRFADQRVSAIMTHRSRVAFLDVSAGAQSNSLAVQKANHSMYPVMDGYPEKLIGFVNIKELFGKELTSSNITAVMRQPIFIHESFSAMSILNTFKTTGNKMAVVVDEYGDTQGIVTATDILESLVGEIKGDVGDHSEIVIREDGSFLVDAHASLQHVFEALSVDMNAVAQFDDVNTISGFVLHHFKDIPHEADFFVFGGFKFEVMDMDGHKIDKVLIAKVGRGDSDEELPADHFEA